MGTEQNSQQDGFTGNRQECSFTFLPGLLKHPMRESSVRGPNTFPVVPVLCSFVLFVVVYVAS